MKHRVQSIAQLQQAPGALRYPRSNRKVEVMRLESNNDDPSDLELRSEKSREGAGWHVVCPDSRVHWQNRGGMKNGGWWTKRLAEEVAKKRNREEEPGCCSVRGMHHVALGIKVPLAKARDS